MAGHHIIICFYIYGHVTLIKIWLIDIGAEICLKMFYANVANLKGQLDKSGCFAWDSSGFFLSESYYLQLT